MGKEGETGPSAQPALLVNHQGASPELGHLDLRPLGDLAAARYLFERMARPGAGPERAAEVERLALLLRAMGSPRRAARILETLLEAGRFFDIYPLEVLDALIERDPDYLSGFRRGELVLNRPFLESRIFEVEETLSLVVPLAAKVRGFALAGGGSPGYCLSPGPPGAYAFELGGAGRFEILLFASVRGERVLDRVRLWVEEPPDLAAGW